VSRTSLGSDTDAARRSRTSAATLRDTDARDVSKPFRFSTTVMTAFRTTLTQGVIASSLKTYACGLKGVAELTAELRNETCDSKNEDLRECDPRNTKLGIPNNLELHNFCSSPRIISVIEWKMMR
jgi:hypothetical protein